MIVNEIIVIGVVGVLELDFLFILLYFCIEIYICGNVESLVKMVFLFYIVYFWLLGLIILIWLGLCGLIRVDIFL